MSDNVSNSIQELRRMVSDQNRIIFNLRSQIIDQRAVILQNLSRIERLECFASNNRGGRGNFRLRYNPMAAVELTLLGNRLEDRARRHRVAIGASTLASTVNEANGGEPWRGKTVNSAHFTHAFDGHRLCSSLSCWKAKNVPSFGPTIERHMERSRHRLLHDEMVQRSVQQHFQHQQQQLVFQAQQQEHRRREVQRQFEVAEQLQEEIQAAEEGENDQENEEQHQQQQQGRGGSTTRRGGSAQGGEEEVQQAAQQNFERTVRLQLRESPALLQWVGLVRVGATAPTVLGNGHIRKRRAERRKEVHDGLMLGRVNENIDLLNQINEFDGVSLLTRDDIAKKNLCFELEEEEDKAKRTTKWEEGYWRNKNREEEGVRRTGEHLSA
ncbi:hypothetical protein niasHT_021094 [Heterodera trifolii]|uniref:Uncharacterized protein n=1 Tax=Heterodera trifolii TaxID=157864 RepID=A0ABD2KCY1_9BILA